MKERSTFLALSKTFLWIVIFRTAEVIAACVLMFAGAHFVYGHPISFLHYGVVLLGSYVVVMFMAWYVNESVWQQLRNSAIYSLLIAAVFFGISIVRAKLLDHFSGFSVRDISALLGCFVLYLVSFFYLKSVDAFIKK
jgi:hypothetical protein